MILGFTRNQLLTVFIILVGIVIATTINLKMAYMRSRNVTRKTDMRNIHSALTEYRNDYANFPASDQGKIVACFGGVDENEIPQRVICEWAKDPIPDIFDMNEKGTDYMEKLPSDPKHIDGRRYLYLSNGRYFQVYAALEGSDPSVDQGIIGRSLICGSEVCNFGLSSDNAPLEKSIEEYENELRIKSANEKNK